MVLSTHAVIGAAVAQLFPTHPLVGFTLGFASHFVADAIPHWHYHVGSVVREEGSKKGVDMVFRNKHFPYDLLKIGTDGLLGLGLAVFFFGASSPVLFSATVFGAVGGMLPDALQFVYWKWKHEPLASLQRFHHWVHAKSDLNARAFVGPAFQAALICLCVILVRSV